MHKIGNAPTEYHHLCLETKKSRDIWPAGFSFTDCFGLGFCYGRAETMFWVFSAFDTLWGESSNSNLTSGLGFFYLPA
jgi:hypothetical protein